MSRFPAAFRPPAFASRSPCSRPGPGPSSRSAYRAPSGARTRTGFPRSTPARYDRGGCPLYPGDGGAPPGRMPCPAGACRFPAASPTPRSCNPSAESIVTRHHQGFTCVHPSGLPLARSLPRTEQGPLGFYLELRTPSRQDLPGARRGGDRSRTLIRNYAPGIAGLQPASSLAIRDIVSHLRSHIATTTPARSPTAGEPDHGPAGTEP